MIKALFLFVCLFQPFNERSLQVATDKVFVCDSPEIERYHLVKNCRGLNACSHDIAEIEWVDAKTKELTLCHWEDGIE